MSRILQRKTQTVTAADDSLRQKVKKMERGMKDLKDLQKSMQKEIDELKNRSSPWAGRATAVVMLTA